MKSARDGAVSFAASISTGAAAYALRDDLGMVICAICILAFVFGFLSAMAGDN